MQLSAIIEANIKHQEEHRALLQYNKTFTDWRQNACSFFWSSCLLPLQYAHKKL